MIKSQYGFVGNLVLFAAVKEFSKILQINQELTKLRPWLGLGVAPFLTHSVVG